MGLLVFLPLFFGVQTLDFQTAPRPVIEQRLKQYDGNDTRREAALKRMFEESGCTTTEQPVKHEKNPNVICTMPGESPAQIVVGAHFDHVPAGDGVVDNWSSASLLPSFFESLHDKPRRHTFVFVGFTGEEHGLVGSEFYVKQLSPQQADEIRAMVNMDTLGLAPTKVWASRADPRLLQLLSTIATTLKSPLQAVNVENLGSTDSESFRHAHIPAITIHSVTAETWSVLHSPRDKLSAIHLDEYYETYRLVTAYLAMLDAKLD